MPDHDDPFREARAKCPVLAADFQNGETIPMILRLKDVRQAARDWKTYSSDAPRRVPIPSEENVRTVAQYPLEVDPPVHAEYRKLVEPFFLRPKQPEVKAKIERLIDRLIGEACERGTVEVVREFAIPLQSHALTYLLNVDEKEAETCIGWGVHVFKEGDGESKGMFMENYCREMFEAAEANPGEDFFSALNQAEFQGRRLTMEEKLGYANIAFAGGRDTIIHTATRILAYFAEHPEGLDFIRQTPNSSVLAAEEFFRVFMPLTHIGRVCPHATDVHGHRVEAGGRVSLAWSSANRDPEMFDQPNRIKLDRKPNPHISFGYGIHLCLGAHHARAIMRALIEKLAERVGALKVLEAEENLEREADYTRMIGYERLLMQWTGR
ncbi:MAG: cytochrome P450 [Verrucomicrobiota bacterium]